MKAKFYFCDVWRMNYWFYIGWNWDAFVKRVKKDFDYTVDRDVVPDGISILATDKEGVTRVFVWTKKKDAPAILAHECLHAANRTLGRAGVHADFYNDEAQAYLMLTLIEKAMR